MKVSGSYDSLRALREQLLGLRVETVVEATGIAADRLRAVEAGASPSVLELELLGDVYGVDADALYDHPIVLPQGSGIGALASLDEFQDVGQLTRVRIVRAANAARDLVALRRLVGDETAALPRLSAPDPKQSPYEQGAILAHELRKLLDLGVGPIASMRDLVSELLPGVAVLHADLGHMGPAGLAFADGTRGPAVVLNLRGKNENAAVRRFSLAHELCHLLVDWNDVEPLASISGYLSDTGLEREQRANGFAVRFLCPETVIHRLRQVHEDEALRVVIDEYKLHYQAARLYLRNEANLHLPERRPSHLPDPSLEAVETPRALADFPLLEVPPERRGVLAETAVRAWSLGKLSRDGFAEQLRITPVAELERVADYFGIDVPEDDAIAS